MHCHGVPTVSWDNFRVRGRSLHVVLFWFRLFPSSFFVMTMSFGSGAKFESNGRGQDPLQWKEFLEFVLEKLGCD